MDAVRALLLTDVVDSTLMAHTLGDASAALLWTAHDRAARDLLPLWRGREIDKTDGMLLMFDAAADAVGYALAYHRALAALSPPLQARAGLHVGPVRLRENSPEDIALGAKPIEVEGLAKSIAARVMAIALGGQTLLSADARVALGVGTRRIQSHGHWRLRGLPEAIELFEVGDATAPFVPPPDDVKAYRVVRRAGLWRPAREIKHSIPAERDSFVGREAPLQQLEKKFADGVRLVSILGMGGTGKTRLATRFAWTWLGDFPGGVWFCDLSQARSADGLHMAVAQGLDVPLGKSDAAQQLAQAIASRGECLVILDNFEQVARHAEETLGRWLDRAPEARFIVTTREVLGIVGEETLALAPLPFADAAALFLQRAQSARQGFQPRAGEQAAIDRLVRLLDCLPLAIELAAARVHVIPPGMLLGRMRERFTLLSSRAGRRDRQATLRATLDWSWDLLSDAEQFALAQLSVFAGGFTVDAVEGLIAIAAHAPSAVDLLQSLIDKSLVREVSRERFDLLQSVHDYAAEQLQREDARIGTGRHAEAAAEVRHGRFFCELGQRESLVISRLELDNLVAACRRAAARADGSAALGCLRGAWEVLSHRGPYRTGLELAEVVGAVPGLSVPEKANLARLSGLALMLLGRPVEAREALETARQLSDDEGDRQGKAAALVTLAQLEVLEGRMQKAQQLYEEGLRGAQQGAANPRLRSDAHGGLAGSHLHQGRLDQACHHFDAALAAAREAQDRGREGSALGNLGNLYAMRGDSRQALETLQQALDIAAETGDTKSEGMVSCNLGMLLHAEGRLVEARARLHIGLGVANDLGHTQLQAVVQCNLGILQEALGEPVEALAHYTAAIQLAEQLRDRRSLGQFRGYLGLLHARQQRFEAALECLVSGEQLLIEVDDPTSLGILLCAAVESQALAGSADAARETLARVERIVAALGSHTDPELDAGLRHARSLLDRCGAAA